jgi:hypothetical protein
VVVDKVKSHKHLGITIKDDLKWDKHIEEMSNKAKKRLSIMKGLKFKLDRRSLETMYTAFVRPILEYGDILWDTPGDNDHLLDELDTIQNNAARIVSGATARCTTASLNAELLWKPLKTRRREHRLAMYYKIVHNLAPQYMTDLVPQTVQQRTNYGLRNREQLDIPRTRILAHTNSFYPATTREWNNIDPGTKTAPSFNAFKSRISKPGVKLNPLYYLGKRRSAVNHTRLRMGCSALKKDLHRLNLVETPTCACALEDEDPYHYFFVCPIYAAHRDLMLETIHPIAYPTLKLVLYGDSNLPREANQITFEAVQRFIAQSKRFF